MKLSSIFNVIVDAQDVLDLFDGVNNADQLRGHLRRVNQLEADDLLACLEGLRTSVANALNDTLELSPDLSEPDDLSDIALPDSELEKMTETEPAPEDRNSKHLTPPEK